MGFDGAGTSGRFYCLVLIFLFSKLLLAVSRKRREKAGIDAGAARVLKEARNE
jgi:hypothetical protein